MIFQGAPLFAAAAFVLAAALALLAVWLRPLARRVTVAFGELWARAMARSRAGIPWREAIAAAVFGGALAAIAGALAGPVLTNRPPRRIAVVIDASASMRAGGERRAIDEARLVAARIGRAVRDGDSLALFRASSETRAINAMELATLEPDDGALDLDAALAMAGAFLAAGTGGEDKELLLVTDAKIEKPGVTVVAAGGGSENLAIEAFGASPGGPAAGGVELLVTVANRGATAATADLVLHTTEFRLGASRVEIAPGARESRAFHLKGIPSREVFATLDGIAFASGEKDSLPHDDRRAAWASDRGIVDVALVGHDRFLEGALAVLGGVRTRVVSAPVAADVVIVRGEREVKGANVLRLGAKRGTRIAVPAIVDWNGEHPATRRVSLDDLTIEAAHVVDPGARGVVLAAAERGPLAVARERDDGFREIVLGFDPNASDFPLRLGFPVFVGSAVRWLAGAEGADLPLSGIAGEPLALDLARDAVIARAIPLGEGRDARATIDARGALVARDAGLYEVRSSSGTRLVEVAASEKESTPVGAPSGTPPPWTEEEGAERTRALGPLLFGLGGVLIAIKAVLG